MNSNTHDIIAIGVKSAPPAIMTMWSIWGHSLQEWAAVVAISYTLLMTFFLLVDRYKKWKKEKDFNASF